jgi:hypothetical protein
MNQSEQQPTEFQQMRCTVIIMELDHYGRYDCSSSARLVPALRRGTASPVIVVNGCTARQSTSALRDVETRHGRPIPMKIDGIRHEAGRSRDKGRRRASHLGSWHHEGPQCLVCLAPAS